MQTAIDLPRFRVGNNFKDVYIENRFKKNLYKYLKSKNINPILCDEWTDLFGGVEGIFKNKSNNFKRILFGDSSADILKKTPKL